MRDVCYLLLMVLTGINIGLTVFAYSECPPPVQLLLSVSSCTSVYAALTLHVSAQRIACCASIDDWRKIVQLSASQLTSYNMHLNTQHGLRTFDVASYDSIA